MKVIVTVVGKDRVGIIAEVCSLLAERNINIMDISQTILQGYFTMIMLADTSNSTMPFVNLLELLRSEGTERGLDIHMQREDIFNAMHRI